jgi:uncharacterized protein with NRDE domain
MLGAKARCAMCTLIVFHRCFSQAPLVLAANRDEYLDRPAEKPALRQSGNRAVLAPRDLRAGGTWLGVNDAGLVAALTNRPCKAPDPLRRSRGSVVFEALSEASAGDAVAALGTLPERAYNPFNFFAADGDAAFAATYEGKLRVTRLEPGFHVIGNADPDDRRVPKIARLLAQAERIAAGDVDDALDALAEVCRSHQGDGERGPLDDTCIHAGGYGTRSSTLLRLGPDTSRNQFHHAEGAPCQTEYEDLTPFLSELDHRAGVDAGTPKRKAI